MDPFATWLVRVRRLALVAHGVSLGVAAQTGEPVLAPLSVGAALAVLEALRTVAAPRAGSPALHGAADLIGLSALIGAWGESHQPLTVFFLVDIALFATFAPRAAAWAFTAGAVAGQALALFVPVALGIAHHREPLVHLAAHTATFSLGALALTPVLASVAEALRRRTDERDRAARLAAIGTLAAGVAHELATPLGSIELLAEELAAGDAAALAVLRGQVARCRAILDRMLARAEAPDGTSADLPGLVRRWVDEWRRGAPGVPVDLVDELDAPLVVRGAEEGWRAAVWTVLDNARRAGPPIVVRLGRGPRGARITVEDEGPGVDADVAARIGEPFVSRWAGAGLGLYVARTFARAAGGDIELARRPGRGTAAHLDLRQELP